MSHSFLSRALGLLLFLQLEGKNLNFWSLFCYQSSSAFISVFNSIRNLTDFYQLFVTGYREYDKVSSNRIIKLAISCKAHLHVANQVFFSISDGSSSFIFSKKFIDTSRIRVYELMNFLYFLYRFYLYLRPEQGYIKMQ